LVDDLHGSIHRKYSRLPNPAFLIDKSGHVACSIFVVSVRMDWAWPSEFSGIASELLALITPWSIDGQRPCAMLFFLTASLFSIGVWRRGGKQSLKDFRHALDLPGRGQPRGLSRPLLENPGRSCRLPL